MSETESDGISTFMRRMLPQGGVRTSEMTRRAWRWEGRKKERERDKEGAAAVSKKKAGAAASPSFPPLRLPQRLNKHDSHV